MQESGGSQGKRSTMARESNAPNPGSGDCYNRVTQTCNSKHPGKDMGDADYRNCINGGLDWCDTNEPARAGGGRTFPVLVDGRFQVVAKELADDQAPDEGDADCYNRVTETCNRKHPGKDIGDADYRACISSGLDWCDVYEPLLGGGRVY